MTHHWSEVIGRVSFVNCDPLFHSIDDNWGVLPAPPAWLTGHVLRQDCLVAPIPAADYAANHELLQLLPDIGIASDGAVGSVLLFSPIPISEVKSVALPTDSSTSKQLLKFILSELGYSPTTEEMGPELDIMLTKCDAALLIGDRAIDEAERNSDLIKMDLGEEWKKLTGLPMVFGVFAARKDSSSIQLNKAHKDLLKQLDIFENQQERKLIVQTTHQRSGFSAQRIDKYFDEVQNRLDGEYQQGLVVFLSRACGMVEPIQWFTPSYDV